MLRPWGLEPTVRRRVRPIEPFTSTVRQRSCSPTLSRSASTPIASPAREPRESLSAPPPTPGRDVLPAPPLGGAPRLPRPCSSPHREGETGWTSETILILRCCQSVVPLRGRPAAPPFFLRRLSVGRPLSRSASSCEVLPLVEITREHEL